jgi:hypothetical protein
MRKLDVARREFLAGAAVGAGVVAGGGNKDFAGWRLIGFPGGQPLFTPEDLESAQAFTREPIVGRQGRA